MKDEKALSYLKHYPQKYPKDLRVMFPGAPLEAIDLLKKTLRFNPNQRVTLEDCLNHPFITSYSKREPGPSVDPGMLQFLCASLHETKPAPVSLDFDNEQAEPSRGRLWELILGEIQHYKIVKNVTNK